jgi:hypothetical protein
MMVVSSFLRWDVRSNGESGSLLIWERSSNVPTANVVRVMMAHLRLR